MVLRILVVGVVFHQVRFKEAVENQPAIAAGGKVHGGGGRFARLLFRAEQEVLEGGHARPAVDNPQVSSATGITSGFFHQSALPPATQASPYPHKKKTAQMARNHGVRVLAWY